MLFLKNFAVAFVTLPFLVKDLPPNQPSAQSGQQRQLLLGLFHGVPTTIWERVERLLDYLGEMFTLHPSPTGLGHAHSEYRWPRSHPVASEA